MLTLITSRTIEFCWNCGIILLQEILVFSVAENRNMSRIKFSCVIEFWTTRTLSCFLEDMLYKAEELKGLSIKPMV